MSLGAIGAALGAAASKVGTAVGKVATTAGKIGSAVLPHIGTFGSLLGSFGHSSGGGLDVAGNMQLMRYQTDLNKEMTQWQNENQWKFMRKGLEDANYNPLLALGASPSTGNVGLATGSESTSSSSVGLNGLASIMNTAANTKLQEQQALTEYSKRVNLSADTGLKLVDTMYKKGLIKWQDVQNYAELAMKKSSAALNTASAKYTGYNAETNRMNAYTNSRNSRTNQSRAEYDKNRKSIGGLGFSYSFSHRDLY